MRFDPRLTSIDDNNVLDAVRALLDELIGRYQHQIDQAPYAWATKLLAAAYDNKFTEQFQTQFAMEVTNAIASAPESWIPTRRESRAMCPLCGDSAQILKITSNDEQGFSVPEGLYRHLRGVQRANQCEVLTAASRLVEIRQFRDIYPFESKKPLLSGRKRLRRRIKELEVEQRRQLAQALVEARKRLDYLNDRIHKQTEFVRIFADSLLDRAPEYPRTPDPILPARERGEGLPSVPGVYFVWSNGAVVYVGKSTNITQRARIAGHMEIHSGDLLSWLPFEENILDWAECFYIGIHRPIRNFGRLSRAAAMGAAAQEGE